MKYGLNEDTVQRLTEVFQQFPNIDEVIIYGSRAKGNFKPGSDIDITLKGEALDLSSLSALEVKIDDLMLPYKFDISIFSKLQNQEFIDHISRVGLTFYKKR